MKFHLVPDVYLAVARRGGDTPPVDPALLARPDVRAFLADHDIGALYRVLGDNEWIQRGIAKATKNTAVQRVGDPQGSAGRRDADLTRRARVSVSSTGVDDHPRTPKAAHNLATAQRLLTESAWQGDSTPPDK